jgi:two-component sensor histidine kinase
MKASINSLHHQETDWLRELDFYKQELNVLTNRLEEVASKNTSKEISAQVEHFQNRFIILKEQHDILRHDNAARSERLNEMAKAIPTHIEEKFVADKDDMHKRMSDYFTSFRDTRFEFNNFLSKVL